MARNRQSHLEDHRKSMDPDTIYLLKANNILQDKVISLEPHFYQVSLYEIEILGKMRKSQQQVVFVEPQVSIQKCWLV